jgi:hypothetical protein
VGEFWNPYILLEYRSIKIVLLDRTTVIEFRSGPSILFVRCNFLTGLAAKFMRVREHLIALRARWDNASRVDGRTRAAQIEAERHLILVYIVAESCTP